MKLLIAGDSYASFFTPKNLDYATLEIPSLIEGHSFGELLASKFNIPVESSAISGGANPMTVMNALRHILKSQNTDQPITHCIFHYTQSSRISSNSTNLTQALKYNNVTPEDYFKHSIDSFIKSSDSWHSLDQIILEFLIDCDFAAGSFPTSDTEKLYQFIKETPIAKIVADSFAYMSLLESCCNTLNVKLIVFSMFVPTDHLFRNVITELFKLNYAIRFVPNKSWTYYTDEQCKTNNLDRNYLVSMRPGNHLYPEEHEELANDFLIKHPNFFR